MFHSVFNQCSLSHIWACLWLFVVSYFQFFITLCLKQEDSSSLVSPPILTRDSFIYLFLENKETQKMRKDSLFIWMLRRISIYVNIYFQNCLGNGQDERGYYRAEVIEDLGDLELGGRQRMKEEDSNWIPVLIWTSQVLSFLFSVSSKSSLSPHQGRQRADLFFLLYLGMSTKQRPKEAPRIQFPFVLSVFGDQ